MPFSRMSIVTATYWLTAFHFARREAGTTTPWPADTARSPVTASSRPMMTTTTHAAILSIVSTDTRAAATGRLTAIGCGSVPSAVTWLRRRASTPSSQSVNAAAVKMAAGMRACTRELEMRKRINSGTATMRVRVSPIGKFTLRSRSPGPWAVSLSARGDDLVNVGAVHRHDPRGIQAQARGDVGRAAPRGQMPRPRRVVGQPGDVLAVGPGRGGRRLGSRRRARPRLAGQRRLPHARLLGRPHRHDARAAVGERGDDAGRGPQHVDDEHRAARDGAAVEAVGGDGDVHAHAQARWSRSERIFSRSALRLMKPSASRWR